MSSVLKPVYLLAESQLLFWKNKKTFLLDPIIRSVGPADTIQAAYLGASNGDNPDFYGIFAAAMENCGVRNSHLVPSSFSPSEKKWIEQADLILLSGGDTELGWNRFRSSGVAELLAEKYASGAILIGVSAGAMQLGLCGWKGPGAETVFETLKLVPFVIDMHDERNEWRTIRKIISVRDDYTRGIGIPSGGGMIYHPDQTVEPLRRPLQEFFKIGGCVSEGLLFPVDESSATNSDPPG